MLWLPTWYLMTCALWNSSVVLVLTPSLCSHLRRATIRQITFFTKSRLLVPSHLYDKSCVRKATHQIQLKQDSNRLQKNRKSSLGEAQSKLRGICKWNSHRLLENIRMESGSCGGLKLVPFQLLRIFARGRLNIFRYKLQWGFQWGRHHIANQRPVDAFEESVALDVGRTSVRAQPLERISLQEVTHQLPGLQAHRNACREDDVSLKHIGECSLSVFPSEWRSTI